MFLQIGLHQQLSTVERFVLLTSMPIISKDTPYYGLKIRICQNVYSYSVTTMVDQPDRSCVSFSKITGVA